MRPFDDSLSMTHDERRAANARILAAGILPLHTRAAFTPASASDSNAKNTENPGSPRLEVSDETVLSVHNG